MKDYRKLKIWEAAHAMVLAVYRATAAFPKDEVFSLTSQLRRSALSVPSNIAEGCGRQGDAELSRFCLIASGSASELDYQLLLARDLGYIDDEAFTVLFQDLTKLRQMLNAFIQKLSPQKPRTNRQLPTAKSS